MDIGETLKSLRNIYGYSGRELSQKIGISPGYLSEIENNKKKPSLEVLSEYSKALDLKMSTLILLAEEDEKQLSKGKNWIRKRMINLIQKKTEYE